MIKGDCGCVGEKNNKEGGSVVVTEIGQGDGPIEGRIDGDMGGDGLGVSAWGRCVVRGKKLKQRCRCWGFGIEWWW